MRRLGLRIANVVLFVFSCFLLASIVNQISAELLAPADVAAAPPRARAQARSASWNDRKIILDRNLFGAQLVSHTVAIEPEPEPEEELDETRLPLKLLGTIAAGDQNIAKAAIEDSKTRDHQVVRVGDTLQNHGGVTVARIERRRVILQNGPRREELSLDDAASAGAPKPSARTARRPSRTSSRATRTRPSPRNDSPESLSSRLKQLREAAGGGSRDPSSLFSQARILPKYEDGEMMGVQLSAIEPGSFYEQLGIQEGDVITELNGIKIDSAAASAQILGEFTEASDFKITVQGASGARSINVGPDKVAELLSQ